MNYDNNDRLAPDNLPRWIDDLKGNDPTIDSLIEYIIEQGKHSAPGTPEAPADLKKRMADALNVTLWLYRRLPGAYGRPPFVDAALLEMAKIADIDAQGAIAERAAQLDGGQGEAFNTTKEK